MDINKKSLDQTNELLLNEAEALIWAMLDDNINPADIKRLESMLQENEQVRQRYISCVQTHTDLNQHFGEIAELSSLPSSPTLDFLGDLQPGTGFLPPVAE